MLPHVRESGFQNPGNLARGIWNTEVLLLESGIHGYGITNTAQGIWNPNSTDKESGI